MSSFVFPPVIVKVGVTAIVASPTTNQSSIYKGSGRISGLVREKGTPASHRVNLHVRPQGTLVATTWAGADGSYVFKNIAKQFRYYIVCVDERGGPTQYQALVQDMVQGDHDETIGA